MVERFEIHCCDCFAWTRQQPDDSVDLVIGSPPYEAARTYGIDFKLRGQAWVDWAVERFVDQYRICRGVVCWVVEGQTRDFRWSATPALFMADLHRAGVHLRKPPIYFMPRWAARLFLRATDVRTEGRRADRYCQSAQRVEVKAAP